jgi:hypothetical protein
MRGLLLQSFLVALALAAACVPDAPFIANTGGSTSASTTGGLPTSAGTGISTLTSAGGGVRSCGVSSTNLRCNSCIQADCCYFAHTCGGDPTCLGCAAQSSPPASCGSDEAYVSFMQCLTSRCGICFGAPGSGPTTTASTGDGTPAVTSSTSSVTTTSGGGFPGVGGSGGGFPGVGGSGGGFSGVGGSASVTSSSSSSGHPTSCGGADWGVGCCDASGDVWYCNSFGTLEEQKCDSGKTCGWNPFLGYYDCVKAPGVADPSGLFPRACRK